MPDPVTPMPPAAPTVDPFPTPAYDQAAADWKAALADRAASATADKAAADVLTAAQQGKAATAADLTAKNTLAKTKFDAMNAAAAAVQAG